MPIITCHKCNRKTKTIGPIFIKRLNNIRFCVFGVCDECQYTKYKFLNYRETQLLPNVIHNNMRVPGFALNKILDSDNNTHDLYPLIDPIVN